MVRTLRLAISSHLLLRTSACLGSLFPLPHLTSTAGLGRNSRELTWALAVSRPARRQNSKEELLRRRGAELSRRTEAKVRSHRCLLCSSLTQRTTLAAADSHTLGEDSGRSSQPVLSVTPVHQWPAGQVETAGDISGRAVLKEGICYKGVGRPGGAQA